MFLSLCHEFTQFVLEERPLNRYYKRVLLFTSGTRSIWKMLGPFATASRRIAIHQVSLLLHAATVARHLRIDVHNKDDNA